MARSLKDQSVVVIGGSSGIGLSTARLVLAAGARVTIVGRDPERLATALDSLGEGADGASFDVADEAAVAGFFGRLDHVDHVAVLAGTHVTGTLAELDTEALRGPVDNRFWGPLFVAKHAAPKMEGGSITLTTGAGVARPRPGNVIVTAAAGGSEFLARAMAVELAPIRVNVVRPGIVETPLLDRLAGTTGADRQAVLDLMAKRVPLQRVAQPEEIADAFLFLMANRYVTGTTLTVDGGASL